MRFAGLALATTVAASEVTPVQKVIQLLEGMATKGKEEKHAEQVQFARYKQFCEDTSADKQRSIADANIQIEKLTADMEAANAEAKRLGKEIAAHESDVATYKGDEKAATTVRGIEKADYDKTHKDYSESVDALGRAITVLKSNQEGESGSIAGLHGEDAFLQVEAVKPLLDAKDQDVLTSFLQQTVDNRLLQAPVADAYNFQSGGVVEMLEKLEDKFQDERTALENAETNSVHAYKMLMQDLAAQIKNGEEAISEKTKSKADMLQKAANAKGDRTDTTATRDADSKYLADLTAECEQKATDFESRQQLRADELTAIEKAIEIMSSGDVSGNADKHLPALIQGTSLIQLRTSEQKGNQERALRFLQKAGVKLHSRVLAQLASTAGEDPFKKVKKLVQDLIVRLMEEANEEAEHKGWCDTELAANEATRSEKTTAVETLHAEIDSLEASIAKLTKEIADLAEAISALDRAMAEATKLRGEEKEENTTTIADAKDAQGAVQSAMTVLKEFYAKAGTAVAMIQQQPESPAIFDSSYQGMQSENGGVVGMLEVILSDFARLESDTQAAENEAQTAYDTFMQDSEVDKAEKSKDSEHKTTKKQDQGQALTEKKGDLEGTQKELDAALAYFDKLKPTCISSGVSYDDRVARREEEIQSLQEALQILNGEDIA